MAMLQQKSPILLAFDCALPYGSVAVQTAETKVKRSLLPGTHAAQLIPTIEDCLTEASTTMQQVTQIITTRGPGSFTGIRIGLAAAHGLAMALQIPLHTCTSLEAVVAEYFSTHPETEVEVALNMGKGDMAVQRFFRTQMRPQPLGDMQLLPHAPASSYPRVGNVPGVVHTEITAVNAAFLCQMALHLPPTPLTDAMPLYIRPPDAKIPQPMPWLSSTL